MEKKKTALEVNTDSDTSNSKAQETEDRDTQNSSKGLDKTTDDNKTSDNGNGYTAEVNDSSKNITDASDSSYMTDTEESDGKTATDTVEVKRKVDADNTNTVNTEGTDRKLSNIEKYRQGLSKEEQSELARKGGIKSGEVRRERKTLGEELKLILAQGDNQERLCMALFTAALGGNYKAFNSLRDTIGEMPTQKQEVTTNMTEGDRELLENVRKRLKEQNVTK